MEDAWKAFDKANDLNGETPFHLSVVLGNIEIIRYLVTFVKLRERYMVHKEQQVKEHYNYLTLKQLMDIKSHSGFSPFLIACKDNNYPIFKLLFEEDCDILV